MQAAKQIMVEQELPALRARLDAGRPWIESIHLKQNSALRRIDGMFSTAANALARSFGSGR
jgi:hypothetical protein